MTIRRADATSVVTLTGEVQRPGDLDGAALQDLPGSRPAAELSESAPGRAVPVASVLERVGATSDARFGTVVSDDGLYSAAIPIDELRSKGWLLIGDSAAGLPRAEGGPFRLIVPDGATLCWNVKAVAALRVTMQPEPDSVPANPTH